MFFLMILAFMATALFSMVPVEQNSARYNQLDTQAHYVATAGVKHALAWLDAVIDPAESGTASIGKDWSPKDNPFATPSTGQPYMVRAFRTAITGTPQDFPYNMEPATQPTGAGPDDSWYPTTMKVIQLKSNEFTPASGWVTNVTIFPDKWTWWDGSTVVSNPNSQPKPSCYTIVALAGMDSNGNGVIDTSIGEKWRLRAKTSVTVDTFARYAYLSDKAPSSQSFGLVNGSRPTVDGPFHTNQTPLLNVQEGASFWNSQVTSTSTYAFTGQLSFSTRIEANTNISVSGGLTYDGLGWFGGNWWGTDDSKRPFADNSTPNASRYNRLIAGGESQIRQVAAITLPSDTGSVAAAAWGIGEDATSLNNLVSGGASNLNKYQVFVNTGSGTAPKGGVVVSGGTKELVLQVLSSNGAPIGDGSSSSATPTVSNNGNSAMKVVMDTRMDQVVANGVVTYGASSQGAAAAFRGWTYGASQYVNQSNSAQALTQRNFTSNINYQSNYQATSQINYQSQYQTTSQVNYTSQYQGTCSGSYLSAGGGSGNGAMQWVTTNGSCTKTANATSNSAQYTVSKTVSSNSAPYNTSKTATSQSAAYSSQYNYTSQYFTGSQLTQGNRVSYNSTSQFGNAWATSYSTATYQATSNSLTTNRFNPTDLVVEMTTNGVGMTLNANTLRPGASFLVNGATQASISPTTNGDTWVIKQYRGTSYGNANQDLFVVSQLTGGLNGAVRVNGDVKGLSGWNKNKRTIAAESRSYFSNGASYSISYNSIRIGENIRQFDTQPGSLPVNYNNNLGLIASNIDVSVPKNLAASYGSANPLKIYAVMLAYKSGFGARIRSSYDDNNEDNDYNENTGSSRVDYSYDGGSGTRGYLNLFGGVIQMNPGVLKESNGSGTDAFFGWANEYFYDPVNAISPPPYFPVLSDFTIYHYQEDRL